MVNKRKASILCELSGLDDDVRAAMSPTVVSFLLSEIFVASETCCNMGILIVVAAKATFENQRVPGLCFFTEYMFICFPHNIPINSALLGI
jgi:hypothetical protein